MYKEKFDLFNQEDGPEKTAPRHPERESEDNFDPAGQPVEKGEFPLPGPLQEIEDEKRAQMEADELLRQIEEEMAEKTEAPVDQRTTEEKYWDKVFPPAGDPQIKKMRSEELRQIIERGPRPVGEREYKAPEPPLTRRKRKTEWPDVKSRQYKDND